MSGMLTFDITVALSSRAFIQGGHIQGFNILGYQNRVTFQEMVGLAT